MIGAAVQKLYFAAACQRPSPPRMIKWIGDQRHRIWFCASNKMPQKMQRFTGARHRDNLRVISQLAGDWPAPVNIILNRANKPRIAGCFWIELPS